MRLWTIHPKYLDSRGLVALWREALLARAVLKGETRGYWHHPQLRRFREAASPVAAIQCYLAFVHLESLRRGYRFDANKLVPAECAEGIPATRGQLDYEWEHLQEKLRQRAPSWLAGMESSCRPDPHPLFRVILGPVADWELTPSKKLQPSPRTKQHAAD